MDKPSTQKTAEAAETTTLKNKPSKQKLNSKKKIWMIVGGVVGFIVLLFVILLISVSVATSAPAKVSDEFMNNVLDNDAAAAYDLMSSEAQSQTSSQDFAGAVERMSSVLTGDLKTTNKEVNAETGSDPSATIEYEIEGSDSYTYDITVNLVQKDGDWEVLNLSSEKQ